MTRREILGLCCAPFASGVLQGLLMGNWEAFVFAVVFSYLFAALVGLPALAFLRNKKWTSLSKHLVVGACAGLACGLLLSLYAGFDGFQIGAVLFGAAFLGLHGFSVALIYWLIAKWRVAPEMEPLSSETVSNH